MQEKDCFLLGKIIKIHGLKGALSIKLDVDTPEDYRSIKSLFIKQNAELLPYHVRSIQLNKYKGILTLGDIDQVEAATQLVGCELYLPLTELPPLQNKKYYFHDLIGCTVVEKNQTIGIANKIVELPGNHLLVVKNGSKEAFIPIQKEFLKSVDTSNKKIEVVLPDGLLELYQMQQKNEN